jgi:hypothetical protein
MSPNSSLLDIPSSIYLPEDGSVKSSAASFMTTGRSESRPDSPITYEDLYREQSFFTKQSQSPTLLLQMRARSRSLGMMSQHTSDILESSSISSSPTPPLSSPPSPRSSIDHHSISPSPEIPTPSYEESISDSPRLRHFPSLGILADNDAEDDVAEVENDYLPAPRQPLQRRPEEGSEELPDYTCSVFHSAIVNQKLECVYPGLAAKKREWVKVYTVLFGTVMRIYLIQPDGSLSIRFSLDTPHREYTLQYAEAGIATDYVKKKYVLRVRAEGEQFLMQCGSEEERDGWVEAIQAGSSIALALEDRNMPKYVTLPRRRRGRYSTSVSRSRPTVQRIQPPRRESTNLHPVHSAPASSTRDITHIPPRTASSVTVGSEHSTASSCNGEAPSDTSLDAATALALCLDASRISRPLPRERILISMLTARQHRQSDWVIISGIKRKINPKTEEVEELPHDGIDSVEEEHRARLLKSKNNLSARLLKIF